MTTEAKWNVAEHIYRAIRTWLDKPEPHATIGIAVGILSVHQTELYDAVNNIAQRALETQHQQVATLTQQLDAAKRERDALQEHENYTHRVMGEIVGTDDSFFVLTTRLKNELADLRATLTQREEDAFRAGWRLQGGNFHGIEAMGPHVIGVDEAMAAWRSRP